MEELLSVPEAAKQLQVNELTLRRWIYKGLIDALTLPSNSKKHHYRVKKSVVEEIKKRRKHLRWYFE